MKTIWKFPLKVIDVQAIEMPSGANMLAVQMQQGTPCVWAEVDPEAERVTRHIAIFGTGHPMPDRVMEYISTFQLHDGALVFHAFEFIG